MPKAIIRESKNSVPSAILKVIVSSLIGCVLMIILFFSASALIFSKDLNGGFITALSFICAGLSGFVTGFIAVRRVKISGLLYGLLSGIPLCLLLMVLTLSISATVSINFLYAVIIILISSAFGGITAVNIKRKIRY
ncbi:MAG: TIGR04086 family membrane protein [Clostridia bacterium]|nr:TIGR04086 family membrane protein [Clostridia bacterium]